jgi:rare lipoprotein A
LFGFGGSLALAIVIYAKSLFPGTIHDGCMNQKFLSGLTATLLISTFGLAPSGYANQSGRANQSESADENREVHDHGVSTNQVSTSTLNSAIGEHSRAPASVAPSPAVEPSTELTPVLQEKVPTRVDAPTPETVPAPVPQDLASPQPNGDQSVEVVKVGEYQTHEALRRTASSAEATVATIQPHPLRGRQAATLYVRNIPVLTFLGESVAAQAHNNPAVAGNGAEVKVASVQNDTNEAAQSGLMAAVNQSVSPENAATSENSTDPVWQATAAAARLNQLYRNNVNASEIKITWNNDRQRYIIHANDTEIVALDEHIVLPDTVANESSDVLQATNRIRRQMGNASPLSSIEGDPNSVGRISFGSVQLSISGGLASWYGPGFDGNYSASGEVFNQNAMTAAHPSLPFGTQVRVTNLDNGQSVVVRINDRGPYAHGRVIDLSTGAARIIGLVSSGVAPVSLEVLGAAQTGAN